MMGLGLQCFADTDTVNFSYTVPENIIVTGVLNGSQMAMILTNKNTDVDPSFAKDFALLYIQEAAAEGVNHDIAFSQMCL